MEDEIKTAFIESLKTFIKNLDYQGEFGEQFYSFCEEVGLVPEQVKMEVLKNE